MTTPHVRVMIVEDHLVVRVGISTIIDAQPDMSVVCDVRTGEEALEVFGSLRPDLTLMDLRLPGMDGAETTAAIRRQHADARIIILSTYSGDEDVRRVLRSGASAYLTKDVLDDELARTIRLVATGGTYLTASAAAALSRYAGQVELSAREREILAFVVQGLGNKQIGAALHIAEQTVKNHLKSVFAKLGVADRTDAATTALRRGIVRDK